MSSESRINLEKDHAMDIRIETEQEEDGRWLTEVFGLSGVMAYGTSKLQAMAKAEALALHALAERLEHNESHPENIYISLAA